ncbi:amyloid-beta A4 precursor protein-binding family A member 2 isoform X5 [Culex quinquefasciatus]|uniref:amyloid-beta A4 precursor protein-binding family A member 2 isoform X5 n=1 Tax=Culex quinquefasciatus TaxID=7176 RepID=UPI0018E2F319|nr:amyloid-beta A4 precursor protein-binding family A member 2 isoform X5 [Culex quinquefasciatus]
MSYSNGTAGQLNTGPAPPPSTPRQPQPGRPQSYAATSALYTSKDSADRLLWEMRAANRTPNTTPVSTVLNSPDLTDLDTKMRYQHSTLMQHHQIKVGRSPVGSGGNNDSNGSTNPSSPTAIRGSGGGGGGAGHRPEAGFSSFSLLSDGEMVVFDDIDVMGGGGGGSWRMAATERDILGSSPVPSENENSCASSGGGGDERNYYDVDSSKIQRIIGGLTIAEYEGSPRRFGNIDRDEVEPGGATGGGSGKIGGMPRPGFPKRVISPCMSDAKGVDPQQSSELIDLNDDGSEPGRGLLLSNRISDSKFNLATYVDYFGSVVGSELAPTDDLDPNNQTPTNVLLTSDEGNDGGGDGRRPDDDDYFFSYSTNRNAQNNSYVGHRLATRRGSLERSESDERQQEEDSDATVANNYPYYQKYSNQHYHYTGSVAPQPETHNQQQQQRYYHSHHAHYHGYGSNTGGGDSQDIELYIDSGSRSESELEQQQYKQHMHQQMQQQHQHSQIDSKLRNFTLSPETTDYDSNCGDLDSEVSLRYIGNEYGLSADLNGLSGHGQSDNVTDYGRLYSSMPILEDGLSSGHASDTENNLPPPGSGISIVMDHHQQPAPQQVPPPGSVDEEPVEPECDHPYISSIQRAAEQQQQQLDSSDEVQEAIKDIKAALQMTKILPSTEGTSVLDLDGQDGPSSTSPVWVPRSYSKSRESIDSDQPAKLLSADEEEADTDLETDRLLGQQRLDDHGFGDDKDQDKTVLIEGVLFRARYLGSTQLVCEGQPTKSTRMMQAEEAVSRIKALAPEGESQPSTEVDLFISTEKIMVLNTDLKEIMMDHALRTISYIADIGDLVVLMARRRFVPQDADPGDPALTSSNPPPPTPTAADNGASPPKSKSLPRGNRTPKMICHVFESEEAQFIAQSIGQAFQVAYMEFLKANGIEDHSFMKEMDYQEVLNSQEIFGDELEIFAKKELQKEVVVPKAKGEILGVVIVESGWGSMLPTVVIANLASSGAAARCGQLNIGDQIIAINGLSLVGLPLSTCQSYIKNAKNQTAVKFTVVPCAPVVEVRIKRPNTKYQLGFSVQNGVICSLLRGGIAERGGVRVGHRIIEINNQSVVAVPHEKIVNLLATSVGEIHMKTMPTSMFRLLTGQENPIYI